MVTDMAFFSYLSRNHRKALLISLLCLASLNVTACDYINRFFYPDFRHNEEKVAIKKPPFTKQNDASIEEVKEIAANTSAQNDDAFTVNPIDVNRKTTGLEIPDNAKLFSKQIKNDGERFERLENKVQQLSDMLTKMSPAITRLVDVESELDLLTFQLEEIINKGQINIPPPTVQNNPPPSISQAMSPAPSPIVETPMIKAPAIKQETLKPESIPQKPASNKITLTPIEPIRPTIATPPPPIKTTQIIAPVTPTVITQTTSNSFYTNDLIQKIRIGDHPNKTRIVFELSDKQDYLIQTTNNKMLISFPNAQYSKSAGSRAKLSNRIKSIAQDKKGNGESFIFDLTKTPKSTKDFRMKPDRDVSDQRVVVDLIF